MLSGGNAFDVFAPHNFKEMIVKHPFKEALHMANDFTRVNFGWWKYQDGQRPDILEYATALAASCDCPGAFIANLNFANDNPRAADIFETFHRWELARATGFITPEIKEELKKTDVEHTLLINESGELELTPWEEVHSELDENGTVSLFVFERAGKSCAVCWHNNGSGIWKIPGISGIVSYVDRLGGDEISLVLDADCLMLPVDGKRYLITDLSIDELKSALAHSYLAKP